MRKAFCLILVLIALNSLSYAQDDTTNVQSAKNEINKHQRAIKWFPLYLLNRFPAAQLGYEMHLVKNLNIEFNGGYVLDFYEGDVNNDYNNRRGFKSGVQLRQYLDTRRMNSYYVTLGFDYHRISYDRQRTFGFDCFSGFGCSFLQFDEYQINRQDRRITSDIGVISDIGRNFYLEMAFGFTLNWRKYRTLDKLTGFDIQYGDLTLQENENELLFRPSVDINLVYRLR